MNSPAGASNRYAAEAVSLMILMSQVWNTMLVHKTHNTTIPFQEMAASISQYGLSSPDISPMRAAMAALTSSITSLEQLAGHRLGSPAMPRAVPDPDQDEEAPNQEEEQMDDSGHHEDPPSPIIPRWDRGTHRCFKRDRDNN